MNLYDSASNWVMAKCALDAAQTIEERGRREDALEVSFNRLVFAVMQDDASWDAADWRAWGFLKATEAT